MKRRGFEEDALLNLLSFSSFFFSVSIDLYEHMSVEWNENVAMT